MSFQRFELRQAYYERREDDSKASRQERRIREADIRIRDNPNHARRIIVYPKISGANPFKASWSRACFAVKNDREYISDGGYSQEYTAAAYAEVCSYPEEILQFNL